MFQDVIMAAFGILILIVIYLLINAKVSDIEFAEVLEEMREEKASLKDSVDEAEVERKALYDDAVKTIENRGALELSKQVEANEAKHESLEKEISGLLAEVEAKQKKLKETISERFEKHPGILSTRREVVERQAEVEALKSEIAETEQAAEETEGVIEKTESYMDEIENQFRVEMDDSLAGESVYLVDFGGRRIRTFKVFDGEQTRVVTGSSGDLLRKIKAETGKKRVFFFVRPDAVDEFNESLVAFRENNIAVGYQPVPAGENLILTKFPDGIPAVEEDSKQGGSAAVGGQAGVAGSDEDIATGGSHDAQGAGAGGSNGTDAQQESQTKDSELASGSEGGVKGEREGANGSERSQEASGEQADRGSAETEKTENASQGSEEVSNDPNQVFKWLLLFILLLLVIGIIVLFKNSKR